MTTRGSQTLTYDEQNQLSSVSTASGSVLYGYDYSGERLYRADANGYTIWIGGIYEINNSKVLCHVIANGQLIATFEPTCSVGLNMFQNKKLFAASATIRAAISWPFENGRIHWTVFGGSWAAILGVCMMGGRRVSLKRQEIRRALRPASLWRSAGNARVGFGIPGRQHRKCGCCAGYLHSSLSFIIITLTI